MKPLKLPTELYLWEAITNLVNIINNLKADLTKIQIKDSEAKLKLDIKEAQELLNTLTDQVCQRFNVIHPDNCPKIEPGQKLPPPPEGKTWFWDWSERMKDIFCEMHYEKLICSACPFCLGLEEMKKRNGVHPCALFPGTLLNTELPYLCGLIAYGDWDERQLFQQISIQHGEEALQKFLAKLDELVSQIKEESQNEQSNRDPT
jgi:hypothetical protein